MDCQVSRQASTQASQPMHLLISNTVHSSSPVLAMAAWGRITALAAKPAAVAAPPFRKLRREIGWSISMLLFSLSLRPSRVCTR